MSVGLGLLHKILTERIPLTDLVEKGVDGDSFIDNERVVYDYVSNHVSSYSGVLPQLATVAQDTGVTFQSFPDEPLDYWIQRVEQRRRASMMMHAVREITALVTEGHIDEAMSQMQNGVVQIQARGGGSSLVKFTDSVPRVIAEHDRVQRLSGRNGVPFGIPYLDEISDGAQAGDTVAIVGRPSLGKSYILAAMALAAFLFGATPLVATYEMNYIQWTRRLLALMAHVSASLIRLGKVGHFGRLRLLEHSRVLEDMSNQLYLMQGTIKSTVEDLILICQEVRPSALYVDGAYLLRTSLKQGARWERVADTAEALKLLAMEMNIPVISTYQFNRKGAGELANIGSSDAVGQLASIVISLDNDEDQADLRTFSPRQYKTLELIKGREGERGKVKMLYDMLTMNITQTEVISGYIKDEEE